MNTSSLQSELARFSGMKPLEQVTWLSCMLFVLSITARGTYEPGTELVANPRDLRRFNELIHRVAGFQMDILLGKQDGIPVEALFAILKEAFSVLLVDEDDILDRLRVWTSRQVH